MLYLMPTVSKRKYQKIEEAEIDLVIKCENSHEFYERYREAFPGNNKEIDSISKIWKRRSEFIKKLQPPAEPPLSQPVAVPIPVPVPAPSPELEILIATQNKILAELSTVMKEHLNLNRELLVRLPKQVQTYEDSTIKQDDTKIPGQKDPQKKPGQEKPSQILIGS